jgi:tetratricopeptide (TPR) repeat protein
MSEMLGNQYFMARKFDLALPLFVEVLNREPQNVSCLKKTIICHTQVKQVAEALNLFQRVIEIDPFIIINTRPEDDDCPCPELVTRLEVTSPASDELADYYNILGMLYLYCHLEKSLYYFRESQKVHPEQRIIASIIRQLHHLNKVPQV